MNVSSENMTAVSRIYRSYHRFVSFINDPTKRKDVRHIAPLIGQPGLFNASGTLLNILEVNDGSEIISHCPSYGISAEQRDTSDVAFVIRKKDMYELLVYVKNTLGGGSEGASHETRIKWSRLDMHTWPRTIASRINELTHQCRSEHVGLYTSQSGVSNKAIPSVSYVIEKVGQFPEGVIRDSYNHLVALTYRTQAGKRTSYSLVAVPVIDDGTLSSLNYRIHLDWSDFKDDERPPVDQVIQFYKEKIVPVLELYPGYDTSKAVESSKGSGDIIAVQLTNGLFIPARNPTNKETRITIPYLDRDEYGEFEWEINQKISDMVACGTDLHAMVDISGKQVDNTYQTFRMIVSNWILSPDAGPNVRKSIENIIFSKILPDYEKRKRLDIILTPTFLSWLAPTSEPNRSQFRIVRSDCRVIHSEDACKDTCSWIDNKCLLKIDETTKLGSQKVVTTASLFIKRVIDELVRFQGKREQLLHRGVSKMSKMIMPIRDNDQLIIPESMQNPFSILHLDWASSFDPDKSAAAKKFYEEMIYAPSSDTATYEPSETQDELEIPQDLRTLIGDQFNVWVPESGEIEEDQPVPLLSWLMQVKPEDIGLTPTSEKFTHGSFVKFATKKKRAIGIIDASVSPPNINIVRADPEGTTLSLLAYLPSGKHGLIYDEAVERPIRSDSLTGALREAWDSALAVAQPAQPVTIPAVPRTAAATSRLLSMKRKSSTDVPSGTSSVAVAPRTAAATSRLMTINNNSPIESANSNGAVINEASVVAQPATQPVMTPSIAPRTAAATSRLLSMKRKSSTIPKGSSD